VNSPSTSALPRESARRCRVAMVLPGLHRVRRGAEVAFESVASELALIPGFEVTLIGTGPADPARHPSFSINSSRISSATRFLMTQPYTCDGGNGSLITRSA